MVIERDETDLGLPRQLDPEQIREARRLAARLRGDIDPGATGPAASAEHRARVMRSWRRGAQGPRLRTRCSRCGAPPSTWCQRAVSRDPEVGFVHEGRDTDALTSP